MYRRVVSLLLLPTILLTQMAGTGHSHDGFQPAGHDDIPHIHLSIFSSHHPHEGNEDRHHGQDADHDDMDGAASLDHPVPFEDHDDDAIYFPASVFVHFQDRSSHQRSAGVLDSAAMEAIVSTPLGAPDLPPPLAHPPPLSGRPHCPVYLQTCALLI